MKTFIDIKNMSDENAIKLIQEINNSPKGVYKICTELGINLNEYYARKRKLFPRKATVNQRQQQIDFKSASQPAANNSQFDELVAENKRLKILLAETMLNMQIFRAA